MYFSWGMISGADALTGRLHGLLQLSVSHTDFSSVLQGKQVFLILGAGAETAYLQIFRVTRQELDLTAVNLLHTLTGQRFSPGYTPDCQDTMAVRRLSFICV